MVRADSVCKYDDLKCIVILITAMCFSLHRTETSHCLHVCCRSSSFYPQMTDLLLSICKSAPHMFVEWHLAIYKLTSDFTDKGKPQTHLKWTLYLFKAVTSGGNKVQTSCVIQCQWIKVFELWLKNKYQFIVVASLCKQILKNLLNCMDYISVHCVHACSADVKIWKKTAIRGCDEEKGPVTTVYCKS